MSHTHDPVHNADERALTIYPRAMDEHARRVCGPLLASWADFEQGHANLLDLSRLAEQASEALDNASAPLPRRLREAAADLEYAYHASEREEHLSAGRRILEPLLAQIDA